MNQELAQVQNRSGFVLSQEQIDTLSQAGIIPPNTPKSQVEVFAQVCKERNLSPFSGEIHLAGYYSKRNQRTEYSRIVGIAGYRKIAGETGAHVGTSQPMFNRKSDGSYLSIAECFEKKMKIPSTCAVIVKKLIGGVIAEFIAEVAFEEFKGAQMWNSMPYHKLAVVAESHALRKAFPTQMSGLYLQEESHKFGQDGDFEGAVTESIQTSSPQDRDKFLEVTKKGIDGFTTYPQLIEFSMANRHLFEDEDVAQMLQAAKKRLIDHLKTQLKEINNEGDLNEIWTGEGYEKADNGKPKHMKEVRDLFGDTLHRITETITE